jgi:hypothetical protein
MPVESLSQRLAATNLDKMTERELRVLLSSIVDAMQAITAKLDADTGTADTNYSATLATFIID